MQTRPGGRVLLGLLLALAAALAACARQPAAPPPTPFLQALHATRLGASPTDAHFLVALLADAGQPAQAQQLRSALWQWQLALVRGEAAPPPATVGAAIAHGATLPAAEALVAAEWPRSMQAAMRVVFEPPGSQPEPPALNARAIGPGLWSAPGSVPGRDYLVAQVVLEPREGGGLPAEGVQLRFGDGDDAPLLGCRLRPEREQGARSGMRSINRRTLWCDALAPARWQVLLPVLVEAARTGGPQPQLLVAPPDVAAVEAAQWRARSRAAPRAQDWARAAAQHREPGMAARSWATGTGVLAAPRLLPVPPTRAEQFARDARKAGDRLLPVLAVCVAAFGIFGFTRTVRPQASWNERVLTVNAISLFVVLPLMFAVTPKGPRGDGWSELGRLAPALSVMVQAGMALVLSLLLHRLYDVLDREDTGWWATIASGWRRALQPVGTATAGEFWGFVMFILVARLLTVPLGKPWAHYALAVLLLPTATLVLRRLQALTLADIALGLLVAILFVLALLL